MRELLVLIPLWLLAALWQIQLGMLPVWLHADLGLLMGLCGMAFLRREVALFFLFAVAFQADLLGSSRLGLLTLSYLVSGGLFLSIERELALAGWRTVALAALAGTAVTHGCYLLGAALLFSSTTWAAGSINWLSLVVAGAIWSGPVAWLVYRCWTWTGLLSPEAQAARLEGLARSQRRLRARRA